MDAKEYGIKRTLEFAKQENAQTIGAGMNIEEARKPVIIDESSFEQYLNERPIYFFGNGAEKCKSVIQHPNAHFLDGVPLLAKYMSPLAEKKFLNEEFEDVAYIEPCYLKEFQATMAKSLL